MSNANFINVHSLTGRRGIRKDARVVEIYHGLGRAWVPVKGAVFCHLESFSEFSSDTVKVTLAGGGWLLPEGGTVVTHRGAEIVRRSLPAGSTVRMVHGGSAYNAATVAVVPAATITANTCNHTLTLEVAQATSSVSPSFFFAFK